MPDKPKILTQRSVTSSRLFKVEEAELEFSNGELRTYEFLRSGSVAPVIVVPMLDKDTVVLVEEYAIGLDCYELGLPKGRVDEGESFVEAANRELKEEAGYGARELHLLKCMTQSPNYMQHKTQIVLAMGLYPESLPGDEPEPLSVHTFSLSNIGEIVSHPNVSEARTIAALYLAKDWLSARS